MHPTSGSLSWESSKTKGDVAFNAGQHEEARVAYTEALDLFDSAGCSGEQPVLQEVRVRILGNRSIASAKCSDWNAAASDALEALEGTHLDSKLACKMCFRVGTAALGLGLQNQARRAFKLGLRLEPRCAFHHVALLDPPAQRNLEISSPFPAARSSTVGRPPTGMTRNSSGRIDFLLLAFLRSANSTVA